MDVKLDEKALEAAQVAWLETASDDYTRLDKSIAAAIRAYLTAAPAAPSMHGDAKPGISHDEAAEIALRLIAGAFRRDGERLEEHLRPRLTIPCRPDRDDDVRLMTYINQQRAAIARAEANAGSRSSERGGA